MSAIPFLRRVWSHSCEPGNFVFLSTKSRSGDWQDHAFEYGPKLERALTDWFDKHDVDRFDIYFCPLPFSGRKRKKDLVTGSKVLWSDIDKGDHRQIKPSVLWESSPGRHQGLWILSNKVSSEKAAELSKGLAYKIGGDKGGWDLTQVLRVPGTRNHKYKNHPPVRVISASSLVYNPGELRQRIGVTEEVKKKDKITINLQDSEDILRRYNSKIPFKIKHLLRQEHVEVGKRSDIIWSIENKLHEIGMSPNEIISVIKASKWNKYKGRSDEDLRLRTELEKIINSSSDNEENIERDEKESKGHQVGLTIESFSDVMGSNHTEPGWLVEGFWMKKSHGIVAGEPKSFKSTLAMDLAVSVASGKPFLGQFKVADQGPVIYVQNENAKWIIQDRLAKIAGHKRLLGKVVRADDKKLQVTWPPELPIYMINQQGFLLTNPGHQKILEKVMEEYKPQLVILDPLYLMFDGDLNSSKDLNPTLSWLIELRTKFNCGILLIHHWKKSSKDTAGMRGGQRMLGSTTLHGWIESAWYITSSKSEDEVDDGEEDVNKTAASATVVLDREFRGAGLHPRVDVEVSMGKFGHNKYGVEVSVHKEEKERSKQPTPKELEEEILQLLKTFKNGIDEKTLIKRTGLERGVVRNAVDRLCEQEKARRKGNLIFKEKTS